VALTANAMVHQAAENRAEGVDGVIAKPMSPQAVLNEIARLAQATDLPAEQNSARGAA